MRISRIWPVLALAGLLSAARPCAALPKSSREFRVTCQSCHTVPPRLNYFGLVFQANHFNWPEHSGPAPRRGVTAVPISAMMTSSAQAHLTEHKTTADFRDLEFFLADGFRVAGARTGGYFIDLHAATTAADVGEGDLENAFVAVPVAGRRGELSASIGQFTPMMFQWDPVNALTNALPTPIEAGVKGFSLTSATPGLRLDFYDHRGRGTADGNYISLAAPFGGRLALNRTATVDGSQGIFAHAFRRHHWTTLGVFAYEHDGNHLEGVIGTCELRNGLYLAGVAANGRDPDGPTHRLSAEAEYVVTTRLALTGRIEVLAGRQTDVAPVAAVTFYPFRVPLVRVTGEAVRRSDQNTYTLFVRGQF